MGLCGAGVGYRIITKSLSRPYRNFSATREEYITRLATKQLTIRVKLNDLKSNMDLSRIASPTKVDLARTNRYQKEYDFLLEKLRTI